MSGEEFVHAVWKTLQATYSANVDRVNDAKIQADVTRKHLLYFTYLKYFAYVQIYIYLLDFINESLYTKMHK